MNITAITDAVRGSDKSTYVVALAGGSASGKSFLSEQLQTWGVQHGYDTVILHQDDFALGRAWGNRHQSPYKWDDPDNYRLDEAFAVLTEFLRGREQSFLAYTLEAHEPVAKKQLEWECAESSIGRRLVIIEGLFAWREPFDTMVDLRVFMEVNFWHRYVLRLQRNVLDLAVIDMQKVTEQYFSFVAQAYIDLLLPMKATADLVYDNRIDLGTIPAIDATMMIDRNKLLYSDEQLNLSVDRDGYVVIANRNGVLFREKLPDELLQAIMAIARRKI